MSRSLLIDKQVIEQRLSAGESLRSIAISIGLTYNREENLLVVTRSQHKKLHAQLEALAFQFLLAGKIIFNPASGYEVV